VLCGSTLMLRTVALMDVGKGGRGALAPQGFENFSKKGWFLNFEREKTNFATFGHPWKNFGKSPTGPSLERILPTPFPMMALLWTMMALLWTSNSHSSTYPRRCLRANRVLIVSLLI